MKKIVLLPLSLILLLSFCQNESSKKEATDTKAETAIKKDSIKTSDTVKTKTVSASNAFDIKGFDVKNRFNATASVLAGVKGTAGPLTNFLDSTAWKENAAFIDSSWARLEKNRLNKMRNWRDKELATINQNEKTLFYPFSGPDFLTAYTLFPNVEKYVMLGLEPVGKLPEIGKMKEKDAAQYVANLKTSLADIFNKSYFITQYMGRDLQSQKVNGTMPVLSFFIKRTGNEIANIKYVVKINQDSIIEVPYDYKDKKNQPFGVRIDIVSNGQPKSIYYFRYDVSNAKFNDTTIFLKYLNKMQGPVATYVKSASYLLHNDFMSNMRKFILAKSDDVVEDDTGIPFKYFIEKNNWVTKVYGEYQKPVKNFNWLDRQKELQAVFDKDSANIPKLPFHLGYHWNTNKDVLIVCAKKK
ncbi:MAG TPA: hypothetical protein VKG26_02165 [Bacteroidia bacterium]|nr:hypothetical protein [Bacteroidia bacterium]